MLDNANASQPGDAGSQSEDTKVKNIRDSIILVIQELDEMGEHVSAAYAQMALEAMSSRAA